MLLFGYKRDVVRNVQKHGRHIVLVDGGDDEPSFAYTVGLWESLKTPELIVFGLPHEVMHYMLSEAADQLQAGGKLIDGARWSGLIEGFDCVSRAVDPSQLALEYFNLARWYRQRKRGTDEGLQAYQLCWPSKADGLFPWQDGVAQSVRDHQLPLYLPRSAVPAAGAAA